MVFWFGDLNYRIESSIAALEVLAHAVSGGVSFLAANDQLNSAREAGDAFRGFHEGEKLFPVEPDWSMARDFVVSPMLRWYVCYLMGGLSTSGNGRNSRFDGNSKTERVVVHRQDDFSFVA